ncbi:MAG: geranylgeranyl reductase family protein [Cyanobacteria bacterium SID2]|nr:geranylgeranyl reductase family protein [Cyanobacteria bacterium SID2]MBP0005756.1 geranylgeranyl reductase family protein [Cyanobacteria bacterium SBC]
MTELYDCIVIGAGPAGGAAAYHLAKKGRSILVLDRQKPSRYRPCAGGVSPAISQWFDFDFAPAISRKVKTVRYTWKYDDPVVVELDTAEPMWMVRRDRFDDFLVKQAKQQGATCKNETMVTGIRFSGDRWTIETDGEPEVGRYLVVADGASGTLAEALKLKTPKTRTAAALEVPMEPPADATIEFAFGQVKNGFIWQFPKDDGVSVSASTFIGGNAKNLSSTLSEYADRVGLPNSNRQMTEGLLAPWDGDRPLHTQNALLVGEAAGFVDPLTAEGIRPSMFSGVKAAEAIDLALSGDANALEGYTQIAHETWGADMSWASRLAGLLYRFPGIAYKVAIKQPIATQIMLKILCGELRYSDVADRAVRKLSGGFMGR